MRTHQSEQLVTPSLCRPKLLQLRPPTEVLAEAAGTWKALVGSDTWGRPGSKTWDPSFADQSGPPGRTEALEEAGTQKTDTAQRRSERGPQPSLRPWCTPG